MNIIEKESKNLEFKESMPKKMQNIVKTCVAFANGFGGKILFGIKDASGEILGVSEQTRDIIYNNFPNCLYDSTTPGLLAHIYEKIYVEKAILVVEIQAAHKKPCFVTKEGIPKGVYIRVGSNTKRSDLACVEELSKENSRIFQDEELIGSQKILSKKLLIDLYADQYKNTKLLLTDKIIKSSFSSINNYQATVTGVLHCCDNPEQYIPEAIIICTRFQGTTGRNIIETKEISGCINEQAYIAFNLVQSWLIRNFNLKSIKLIGKSIIPEEAFREAIINALIHRKYSIPGAIKIALYEDRLEIFSPGNFPGLVDINNLGEGITYLRNPNVARIARKIGLVEKLGSGIKLIFDSCEKAKLKAPVFEENGDYVKVIFSFSPGDEILGGKVVEKNKIIDLFRFYDYLTIPKITEHLKISRNTASRKIKILVNQGEVIKTGKGPSTKYWLASSAT